MSTLTKICVVLLVVLVLFACPIIIQKASVDFNWKAYAEKERTRANLAEATARSYMLAVEQWRRDHAEEVRRGQAVAQGLERTITAKSIEVARLSAEQAASQARMTELTAQLAAQQSTIDSQQKQLVAVSGRLDDERKKNIQLADRLRRSEDQIRDQAITIENAQKHSKFLQEQLAVKEAEIKEYIERVQTLESEVARLKERVGEGVVPVAAVSPVAEKIEGEVLAVKSDLASLNVGAASGVKKGMRFILYRDQKFLAHLRIADVGPSTCAGEIYNRVGEVRKGDKAATRLD